MIRMLFGSRMGSAEHLGDKITLLINDQKRDYTVRGLIPASARVSGDALVMDIGAAQNRYRQNGAR